MTIELKLPELGENITSGKVIAVLVNVGETIAVDQSVIEVETDKALIEVPSSVGGKITEIHLKPGDDAEVGGTILVIEESDASMEPTLDEENFEEISSDTAESMDPAETQPMMIDEPAPSLETKGKDAATTESATAGYSLEPTETPSEASAPENTETPAPKSKKEPAPAAPSVRRIAREAGVDISDVPGSGIGGRISAKDVREFVAAQGGAAVPDAPAPALMSVPVQLPDLARWGEVRREPMSGIRRATSVNLTRAWTSIPHVTQCEKADISELDDLRRKFSQKAETAGGKLTITAILIKVIASALKVFPQFNASVDAGVNEIVYKNYVHVGVAVDTENGLLVPVIRDADKKNIIELSVELGEAAERARSRKLAPDEMQGGSITITNLGGFGGTYFTPIVNWPEVAILGVSRARMEPVWAKDAAKFEPRLMLPLMVSYDHRIIDGADGVKFLRWVADALEEPMLMSLEG
ncbi:MAG: 2-oxo acid dehydrogenase subunit E2 [Nitrospinae bacterium]|nr:2-oxo acid dehydrogenase subunit E2 [Nitrospinota bacterium]